jgi:tripartite-type tricarboxylate transporter receptor subunit TctC
VVENKPGAGGKIAVDALHAAPGRRQRAMLCPDSLQSIYPFVFNKLNYAAQRDILPASTVVEFPMALAVPASSPVKTSAEYAQWVRAHSEHANFGHAASEGQPIAWDCRSPSSSEHRCRTCRFRVQPR